MKFTSVNLSCIEASIRNTLYSHNIIFFRNVSLDKIKEGFLKDEENGTDEEKMFLKDPEVFIYNSF